MAGDDIGWPMVPWVFTFPARTSSATGSSRTGTVSAAVCAPAAPGATSVASATITARDRRMQGVERFIVGALGRSSILDRALGRRPSRVGAQNPSPTTNGAPVSERTYKLTNLIGESPESIEAAVQTALTTSAEEVRGQDWIEIKDIRANVNEDGTVDRWQVEMRVAFAVEED
jgi:dodecin